MKRDMNRGQIGVSQILTGIIVLFVIIIGVVSLIDWNQSGRTSYSSSLENSIETVSGGFMSVLGPAGFILNLGDNTNTNFLMVLSFILISIIVVGSLNSVNIFGEEGGSGNISNLVIGIIVAIIGVRFMPSDLWVSLTAPSSAFVASILVGAPFAALAFVTIKIKFNLASKLLWLFYVIFMSYLIFFPGEGATSRNAEFILVYAFFLVLGVIMMFFDGTVRRFFYKEKDKMALAKLGENLDAKKRHEIRNKIEEWQAVINDSNATDKDKQTAKRNLTQLRNQYGQDFESQF